MIEHLVKNEGSDLCQSLMGFSNYCALLTWEFTIPSDCNVNLIEIQAHMMLIVCIREK